ncbi:hypothetical protein ACTXT7_008151 [Hymenolepis weldensis]
MIDDNVWAVLIEVPTVMRMKFPAPVMVFGVALRANADAYVETLQTIVAKPPWIDNVANGRSMSSVKIQLPLIKLSKLRIHHQITPTFWYPNSPDINPLSYNL